MKNHGDEHISLLETTNMNLIDYSMQFIRISSILSIYE